MSTLSGTKSPLNCPIKKWFGVKTRLSLGSSLTAVQGLESADVLPTVFPAQ